MSKSEVVYLRCDAELKDVLTALAAESGASTNAYVVAILEEAAAMARARRSQRAAGGCPAIETSCGSCGYPVLGVKSGERYLVYKRSPRGPLVQIHECPGCHASFRQATHADFEGRPKAQ